MSRDLETAQIIDGVLRLLVMTGMIGGMIIAPNAVQLGDIILKRLDKRSRARNAHTLVTYMKKSGLVDYNKFNEGELRVVITEKGRERLTRSDFRDLKILTPEIWDGRWRLVLFDIAESNRKIRDALRGKLKALGFYKLQKSAWAYPYSCNYEMEIIRQVYRISSRDIVVAEVNQIDREIELKEYFKIDT